MTGDISESFKAADGSKFEISLDMERGHIDLSQSEDGQTDRFHIDADDIEQVLHFINQLRAVRAFANKEAA